MSDKSCANCNSIEQLKAFDLTERVYCSMKCFQEYYKDRNVNTIAQSHDQLNVQRLLKINEQSNQFLKALEDYDDERQDKIICQRILDLKELQAAMRVDELNMVKGLMKVRERQEGEKVTRYRKLGCNSDLELKDKRLTKLGKMILGYRKSKLPDEWIITTLITITKGDYTREAIVKEMESL